MTSQSRPRTQSEAETDSDSDYVLVSVSLRLASDSASGLGLNQTQLNTVDRGLILRLDSSNDSSRLIRTRLRIRALPLVDLLDLNMTRRGRQPRRVILDGRTDDAVG